LLINNLNTSTPSVVASLLKSVADTFQLVC